MTGDGDGVDDVGVKVGENGGYVLASCALPSKVEVAGLLVLVAACLFSLLGQDDDLTKEVESAGSGLVGKADDLQAVKVGDQVVGNVPGELISGDDVDEDAASSQPVDGTVQERVFVSYALGVGLVGRVEEGQAGRGCEPARRGLAGFEWGFDDVAQHLRSLVGAVADLDAYGVEGALGIACSEVVGQVG